MSEDTAVRPQAAGDTAHPYSPAYEAGGFVFVSGALSVDPSGRAVGGRTEAVRAATDRLEERLATAGVGLGDVVKTTYFVTDVSLRDEANTHYRQAFAEPRPARTFVEVSRLPYAATVEIEAVAYRRRPGPPPAEQREQENDRSER